MKQMDVHTCSFVSDDLIRMISCFVCPIWLHKPTETLTETKNTYCVNIAMACGLSHCRDSVSILS